MCLSRCRCKCYRGGRCYCGKRPQRPQSDSMSERVDSDTEGDTPKPGAAAEGNVKGGAGGAGGAEGKRPPRPPTGDHPNGGEEGKEGKEAGKKGKEDKKGERAAKKDSKDLLGQGLAAYIVRFVHGVGRIRDGASGDSCARQALVWPDLRSRCAGSGPVRPFAKGSLDPGIAIRVPPRFVFYGSPLHPSDHKWGTPATFGHAPCPTSVAPVQVHAPSRRAVGLRSGYMPPSYMRLAEDATRQRARIPGQRANRLRSGYVPP
eukprot:1189200-Prorocentrum_minimum.AAC.2